MTFEITDKLLSKILHEELNEVFDKESIDNLTYNIIFRLSQPKKKSKPKQCTDSTCVPEERQSLARNNDLIIYTDGACSGNGKKAIPTAGTGIYNENWSISKSNSNTTFKYNEKEQTISNSNKTEIYKNSNIRAEGYAILYSLWIIKFIYIDGIQINSNMLNNLKNTKFLYPFDTFDLCDVVSGIKIINSTNKMATIVTDSLFWIDMIEKYIPNWVRNNNITTKKNIDLVIYIEYIYRFLEKNNVNVVFRHVRSHPGKGKDLSEDEIGNDHADILAVAAKGYDHDDFVLTFN
jgi:ribonuclease HI